MKYRIVTESVYEVNGLHDAMNIATQSEQLYTSYNATNPVSKKVLKVEAMREEVRPLEQL